jgi:hypothetical protein
MHTCRITDKWQRKRPFKNCSIKKEAAFLDNPFFLQEV